MTEGLNFKTLMTLRMPEEGKAGFGLKKIYFPVVFSKTRMMESLMKLPDDSIISVVTS